MGSDRTALEARRPPQHPLPRPAPYLQQPLGFQRSKSQGYSGTSWSLQHLHDHGHLLAHHAQHAERGSSSDGRPFFLARWHQVGIKKGLGVLPSSFPVRTILLRIEVKEEPTSGLEPLTCSLRVIKKVFLSVAGVCRTRIHKPFSLLQLAPRCRVLRPRWCQSGVNMSLVSTSSKGFLVPVLYGFLRKVLSGARESCVRGSFANQIRDWDLLGSLDARVGTGTGCLASTRAPARNASRKSYAARSNLIVTCCYQHLMCDWEQTKLFLNGSPVGRLYRSPPRPPKRCGRTPTRRSRPRRR